MIIITLNMHRATHDRQHKENGLKPANLRHHGVFLDVAARVVLVLGRGLLFDGDAEHILINAASSPQLGQNKPAHYPPLKKNGNGWRRRTFVHELFLLITGPSEMK